VQEQELPRISEQQVVVDEPFTRAAQGLWANYDVALDGLEFLVIRPEATPPAPELILVLTSLFAAPISLSGRAAGFIRHTYATVAGSECVIYSVYNRR